MNKMAAGTWVYLACGCHGYTSKINDTTLNSVLAGPIICRYFRSDKVSPKQIFGMCEAAFLPAG